MGSAGDHQILDRHPPGLPERLRAGAQVTMVVVRPRDLKVLARKVKREAKSRVEGGRWVAVMEAGLMPAWLARSGVGRDGGMHWRLVRRFTQREGAWVDCRGDAFLGNRREAVALVSEGQMISLPEVATNSAVACRLPPKPEVPAEVKAAREKARWEPIHLIPDGFRKLGACAEVVEMVEHGCCLLYTSPSPRD